MLGLLAAESGTGSCLMRHLPARSHVRYKLGCLPQSMPLGQGRGQIAGTEKSV